MLDFATCTECGRCQSSCPAWNTDKPLCPKLADHGAARQPVLLRPAARKSMPTPGEAREAPSGDGDVEVPTLVPFTIDPDVLWSLHDVRCVRRGVPGRHRAHRRDRRHAPLRGADGVAVPDRGRADAAEHREPGRPVGAGPGQADRLARRRSTSRSRSSTGRSPTTSSTSTGWAVPARSTSGPARASRRPRGCCTGPASPSPSSGPKESCTGDPARRIGNEYLYQEQGKANVATLHERRGEEDRRHAARTASTRSRTSTPRSAATSR